MKLRVCIFCFAVASACLILELVVRILGLAPQIGIIEVSTPWGEFRQVKDKGYPYILSNIPVPRSEQNVQSKVVVLGDSIAYGLYNSKRLPLEHTFPERLQQLLNRTAVYNLAVPGFNTAQEVAFFKDFGEQFKPTQVVLQFCMNDFCDASAEALKLAKQESAQGMFLNSALSWFFKNSQLFRLLATRAWVYWLRSKEKNSKHFAWCIGEKDYPMVERSFKELASLSKAMNFKVLLIIVPVLNSLDDYKEQSEHRWLADLAKSLEFESIDLLEDFKNAKKAGNNYETADGLHPNSNAHELIAKAIAKKLQRSQDGSKSLTE